MELCEELEGRIKEAMTKTPVPVTA